jgi:alginate O-acetyltransferase complex protein AlgI
LLFVEPFFLLLFLPFAVGLFYAARRLVGVTAALAVIVLVSLAFYLPYGALDVGLLAASLCVNFLIGDALTLEGRPERWRKLLLSAGLLIDFGNLATFKYLDQIVAMAAPSARPILGVAIPAGISFYTFHQAVFLVHAYNREPHVLGFLKDAHRRFGKLSAFVRYAAFVAFFPQLVIGPITYMSEFAPQIERRVFGRLRAANIQVGVTLVTVGLFKKLVIADSLAGLVDPLFQYLSADTPISRQQAALATLGYFFQLYFDFSGYSDIALGIARLFGLRLPMNFDSPLRATGIVDFYRRWHMTLTRVIVVFVFTPLSLMGTRTAMDRGWRGWRARAVGAWAPLLLNFEIIALWHAARLTFVVFGVVHGVWYILESEVRRTRGFRQFRSRTDETLRTLGGVALTVAPLALTFALFRSDSLTTFWHLLRAFAGAFHLTLGNNGHINRRIWAAVGAVAVVVYALPNIYEVLGDYRPAIPTFDNRTITPPVLRVRWRPNLAWGAFVAALAAAALIRLNVPSPFLYGGF